MGVSPARQKPLGECKFCKNVRVVWRFNWQILLQGGGYNFSDEDAVCKDCMLAIVDQIWGEGSTPKFPEH